MARAPVEETERQNYRASCGRHDTPRGSPLVRSAWNWHEESADQTILGLKFMPSRPKPKRQLAICIRSADPDLLTPRRIYEVLPDESAAKSRYIQVIDDEGEDYLYPAAHFVFMEFPPAVKQALLKAS